MSRFSALMQPVSLGVGLFVAAAITLIATIVSGLVGSMAASQVLLQLAQPLCAGAIAVLIYLARSEQPAGNA